MTFLYMTADFPRATFLYMTAENLPCPYHHSVKDAPEANPGTKDRVSLPNRDMSTSRPPFVNAGASNETFSRHVESKYRRFSCDKCGDRESAMAPISVTSLP